jgi:hypothetical protein
VLSVHFCFGLAPQRGHRTDNMRPSGSFSGFTATLFSIDNWTYRQSCCLDFNCPKTGIQAELVVLWQVQVRDAKFVALQHDV